MQSEDSEPRACPWLRAWPRSSVSGAATSAPKGWRWRRGRGAEAGGGHRPYHYRWPFGWPAEPRRRTETGERRKLGESQQRRASLNTPCRGNRRRPPVDPARHPPQSAGRHRLSDGARCEGVVDNQPLFIADDSGSHRPALFLTASTADTGIRGGLHPGQRKDSALEAGHPFIPPAQPKIDPRAAGPNAKGRPPPTPRRDTDP